MVSFQCDGCADTVKKPKLDSHRQRCHAPFTCLDCSTTFNNGEYKSHTTCISEAEKYQGALYKGAKKGKGPAPAAPAPTFTAAPAPAAPAADELPAASTSTIHPSRLQAIESLPMQSNHPNPPSYGARGRGRGGFASAPPAPPRGGRGFGRNAGVTGENRVAPSGGMRSWGSTPINGSPAPETSTAVPVAVTAQANANGNVNVNGEEKKKKKKNKKGDKGGTGSKANSSAKKTKSESGDVDVGGETVLVAPGPPTTTTTTTEDKPSIKKRKRDTDPEVPSTNGNGNENVSGPSEKTLKRLRKNVTKLDSTSSSLSSFISKLAKGKKDEVIDRDDIMQGLKVVKVDDKWVLEVGPAA